MGFFIKPSRPCPECGTILPWSATVYGPMVCPKCGGEWQFSTQQMKHWFDSSLVCGVIAGYLLGYRGMNLVWASIAVFLPVSAVSRWVTLRYFPPDLEPYNPHLSGR